MDDALTPLSTGHKWRALIVAWWGASSGRSQSLLSLAPCAHKPIGSLGSQRAQRSLPLFAVTIRKKYQAF